MVHFLIRKWYTFKLVYTAPFEASADVQHIHEEDIPSKHCLPIDESEYLDDYLHESRLI